MLGHTKEDGDGVVRIRRRIPHRERARRVHPLLCDLWIMSSDHISQALRRVHPLKPLLCVCLLIEIACEESIRL
ncbi:hypothetical protein QJS10_CPB17g00549 [Acorus calamus]|uniref:Uncharacterized protein n=1 Tax=Acorus calamus TaxID=4465 RepID=A0AAV9CVQ1_ACOCL|nr:hypothetical protein QJS10_CPB17g00549 [Acorus calamus]